MKSLAKPRYTQEQYDQASAVYMRWCYEQALREGRPTPSRPARLPLLRPAYGRVCAGVAKAISMHLGVSVHLIRLIVVITSFFFGSGLIAYIFLWITIPAGDPVQQAYVIASSQSAGSAPLSRGNAPYGRHGSHGFTDNGAHTQHVGPQSTEPDTMTVETPSEDGRQSSESLEQMLRQAPKPALLAMAGLIALGLCAVMAATGIEGTLILPVLLGAVGIGVSWFRFNAKEGQSWTMLGGIAIIFAAYAIYIATHVRMMPSARHATLTMLVAGLALLVGVLLAIVPWIVALIRDLGTERALKEREEERADMTAHLHDGVLQTLALIQLHADDQQTVFSLARQQERELREWLYQERTTSDRSVNAGLKQIAAQVEDTHGKPIEVVTVGDARPSAQTDALLDATQQALVNAVTHGGEPVSVYCEASDNLVEVFVRDHGDGFDINAVPVNRLGLRESIIGRVKRRGGTVEIVSRPNWGTEVRMHMPISGATGDADGGATATNDDTEVQPAQSQWLAQPAQ
ncbi:histidine kinase [Bifidobacterium sp. DSM 109960]|uniref:Histidine kinase n=1 Tax=Bifidobacterium erythrocebi TaxID=2675325 RepID=A0A7Y0EUJ9_9BIFI|nr:ATP-binding protein [Bifidobacterium sp. DSM 109960]NMM96695.1 histidine kinase [Bifidobacterium sp. DSM 109960]